MRVPVTGLVDHPGESRALSRAVPPEMFGAEPWGVAGDAVEDPVELDLHLDAVVEGILVRGRVRFHLEQPCGRCLVAQPLDLEVEVAELFTDPARRDPDDEDDPGYELIDDATALDLTTLVRDALLIDLPVRTVCREDCAGLCPVCGRDRNRDDCGHDAASSPDPRWSKLAELDLPPEPPSTS